jgi:hypothetical protein
MMIAPLLAQFQEECRDMRRLNLIDDLGRDLRYAGRTLRREPAFTLVVIATLALGIGASTAIFSVCNAVLLKRLPYPQPERLVMIWEQGRNSPSSRVSAANFVDWRDQSHSFSQMAAINPSVDYVLTGRGEPQRLAGAAVSADFFPLLGVHMETMQQVVSASVGAPRFRTTLVGAFALMALIIASIGIYGVISYSVRQRTREFGVRLAMGATASDVLSLVLRRALFLIGGGLALGLLGSAALTRSIAGLLFDVKPLDGATFVGVPLLLCAVAFLASYIPAHRATDVDPIIALRHE